MKSLFVFNQTFSATSKKSGKPFYAVLLFERRQAQDTSVYFKESRCFVDQTVYEKICKLGFKFGDIVELQTAPPMYFGGSEQLIGLKLVTESPYYDL